MECRAYPRPLWYKERVEMVGAIENLGTHLQTSVPKPQSRAVPVLHTDPLGYTVLEPKVHKLREPKRWGEILTDDGEKGSRKVCIMTLAPDAEHKI